MHKKKRSKREIWSNDESLSWWIPRSRTGLWWGQSMGDGMRNRATMDYESRQKREEILWLRCGWEIGFFRMIFEWASSSEASETCQNLRTHPNRLARRDVSSIKWSRHQTKQNSKSNQTQNFSQTFDFRFPLESPKTSSPAPPHPIPSLSLSPSMYQFLLASWNRRLDFRFMFIEQKLKLISKTFTQN